MPRPQSPRSFEVRSLRPAAAIAATTAAVLLLAACSGSPAASSGSDTKIGVVAGENFWGDIAQQIGGDHVTVTSIIKDPDADPHEYESDAVDAAALATAKLVIENGLGYDDFMSKLLEASPNSGRAVISVQQVLHITGSSPNPHLWYDTARMPEVADAIQQALSTADPANATTYAANAQAFDDSLKPIEETIATIKSKYAGTKIAYTERVPGYLTEAAGLTLGTPKAFTEAVEQGEDPSPAANAAFESAIRNRTVKVLLYNGQVTDSETANIKKLATDAGVPVVGVTETIPATDEDYQSWQLRQTKEILTALGG